jgi:hypothetical protein
MQTNTEIHVEDDTSITYIEIPAGINIINDQVYESLYTPAYLPITSATATMNRIYKGSLDANSPRQTLSGNYISRPLLPHQEATLAAMIATEETLLAGPYYNQVGILGSAPGSGKTMSVLAHIAYTKMLGAADKLTIKSCKIYKNAYSCQVYDMTFKANAPQLIIVSDGEYDRWKDEIFLNTHLLGLLIDKPKSLQTLLNSNDIKKVIAPYDFILLNIKHLVPFIHNMNANDVLFKRIYVDSPEFMTIKKSTPLLHPGFIWLVSSSWQHFLPRIAYYPGAFLLNNAQFDPEWKEELDESQSASYQCPPIYSPAYFEKYMSYTDYNWKQVVRCRKTFICNTPLALMNTIECKLTRHQRARIPILTHKIKAFIENKNIPAAYNELGIEHATLPTIITNLQDRCEKEKRVIVPIGGLITPQCIEIMNKCNEKYVAIKSRLESATDCPICLDTLNNRTYLPCCHQWICSECATGLLTPDCKMKCMYCRSYNSMSDVKTLMELPNENDEHTKTEKIINYISALPPTARVVVYAMKGAELFELMAIMKDRGMAHMFVGGSGGKTYRNRISRIFEMGSCQVLCITQAALSESFRFPSATHIISMYRISSQLNDLLVSRARSACLVVPEPAVLPLVPAVVSQIVPLEPAVVSQIVPLEPAAPALQRVSFLYQDASQDTTSLLTLGQGQYLSGFFQ